MSPNWALELSHLWTAGLRHRVGRDLLKDSHGKATLAVTRQGSLGQSKGQAALVRHFSRKTLWMGQHPATLPLLILLALWGSGQELCSHSLHRIPFILWLSNLNLSFWSSSFFLIPFPSLLYPSPDAQRGRGFRVQMLVVISLCSFISPHPPRPMLLLYHPPLPLIRIWNGGFALISHLCQEPPVCHSNPLSCGYRTNSKKQLSA